MARIHETRATLRVMGDDLDPDEITTLLKHPPTSSQRKGDIRGSGHVLSFGMWRLHADDSIPGNLERQIDGLLSKLTPDLDRWRSISARYRIDFFCGLFMRASNEGLSLSPTVLARMAERGISLGLDIYDSDRP